jgi:hypothetical protein
LFEFILDSAVTLIKHRLCELRMDIVKSLHEIKVIEEAFCDVGVKNDLIRSIFVESAFEEVSE